MPLDKEIIATVVVIISVLGIIIGGVVGIDYLLSSKRCLTAYENYEPRYGLFSKCRVMWNGKLTPVDIIREI